MKVRTIGVRLALPLLAVTLAAVALTWGRMEDTQAANTDDTKTDMTMVINGGQCTTIPGQVVDCSLVLGSTFTLSVVPSVIPTGGYVGWQTLIGYGNLTYKPDTLANEIKWDRSFLSVRAPEPPTGKEGQISHGDSSGVLPPVPVSTQKTSLLNITLNCSGNSKTPGQAFKAVVALVPISISPGGASFTQAGTLNTFSPNTGAFSVTCAPQPTFIGPWKLGELTATKAKSKCLVAALKLAKAIALSAVGEDAYAKVNQAGADIATELSDGNGPSLKQIAAGSVYGQYDGDTKSIQRGPIAAKTQEEDRIKLHQSLWATCGGTAEQQKSTILIMAVTVLHETAHWKDDVKKFPKVGGTEQPTADTHDEEGNQLEKDIFGGLITNGNSIKLNRTPLPISTRDAWLTPSNWPTATPTPPPGGGGNSGVGPASPDAGQPELIALSQGSSPLEIMISTSSSAYDVGEEIPVQVTYRNVGASAIDVMNFVVLEGWPLHFHVDDQATGDRAPFLGGESKLALEDADFTTLQPGETFVQTVNVVTTPLASLPGYEVLNPGSYDISAVYEPFFGIKETASNTVKVTVMPSVGGIALDSDLGALALETPEPSGGNAGLLVGIVAAVVAGSVALGGAAWYARRQVIS